MSVGLLALLDDVAGLVKVAAASLDDVAGQAAKASAKAAGALIDDAAVTPNYVSGFAADRELPIVGKIAWGSIRNKLLFLLPAALLLSVFAPWLITPLLMIGGAYLCYEGAEKIFHALRPHDAEAHEAALESVAMSADGLEDRKVAGAIQTDFILSAEIMTIVLSAIHVDNFWVRAAALALAGVGITIAVYGAVALIVKADDFGLWTARNARTGLGRAIGRGIVVSMPTLMQVLGVVGTAAMTWVGGSIIVHGLYEFGIDWPEHMVEAAAHWAETVVPALADITGWLATAAADFVFGILLGALLIPIIGKVLSPAWKAVKRLFPRRSPAG
ncbi:MAG: DUF808 domain-containing protein [Alphaproteobacteria bacterium]|nr:DUF808 domain-containing protein [Alphaproteobacteria bacterium]